MKKNLLIVTLLTQLVSLASQAVEIKAKDYPFPTQDPLIATVLSVLPSSSASYQSWDLTYRPDRLKKIKSVPQKAIINVQAFKQSGLAPLVFVLGGLGSSSQSGNSLALGEAYLKKGYHVITLPNTVSWDYALAVSAEGNPGYAPTDAPEYYQFMRWVLSEAIQNRGFKVSSVSVIGYSNGGLLAGFLASLDKNQSVPLFKKIILVNPAVDVIYGIQQLDKYYAAGDSISSSAKDVFRGAILDTASALQKSANPAADITNLIAVKKIKNNQIEWLIGDSFRSSLVDVIRASQAVNDRGILKAPYSKSRASSRYMEAKQFSFQSYMTTFVIPFLPAAEASKDIAYETSLYSRMADLKTDPRVFIITNTDDFILKSSDLNTFRTEFDSGHVYLFPFGGHCGNMLSPEHVELYLKLSN